MGDKNKVAQTEGSCDLIVKVGHGILKSIYTSETGDRAWIIRDGISVCPAVGTVTVCNPVDNNFSCAVITVMCALEEVTATGTITVATALEQVFSCGTITASCTPTGEVHACIDIAMVTPTVEQTACGTITLTAVNAADTVTINGLVYTAVCGPMCGNSEFDISGTDCADAADLNCAIANDTRCGCCPCGVTTAVACTVVTVTTVAASSCANTVGLVSDCMCTLAISACGFTGGRNADTVTVDGLTYTAIGIPKVDDLTFDVSSACNTTIATDLADSIDDDARTPCNATNFSATSCTATVTVVACPGGAAGNCLAVSDTAAGRITHTCCFAGGITGDFLTLNGLVYTATVCTRADDTEFSVDCGVCCLAIDLAAAINADTRCGSCGDLSATSCMAVVTIVTDVCGEVGDCVTMATSNACCLTINCCNLQNGNTADTVTVDGNIYTAVAGAKMCCAEFSTDVGDNCTAADLACSICMDARCGTEMCLDVSACSCAAIVTVTAVCSGAASNVLTFTTTDAATLAVSGCGTLTGGNDACTVTVNGLVYTAVCCAKMDDTEFSTDVSDNATATDLADSIDDDVRVGCCGDVTATAACNLVTIVTDVLGILGDCVTISSACMCTLGVGCGFEGGVDADCVTVNGLVFLASCANCNCCGCWDATCMPATNLATVLQADVRTGITVPTHGIATAANVCCVVTITADPGARGSEICLSSNTAARLLTSGLFLTGGLGREVIEINLVAATSGEISMPYFNHPMRDGIFIDNITAGASGRLTFIFE